MRPDRHLRSVVASGGGVGEAPPPARHITFVGARGGHGTTTVACALAVMSAAQQPTTLAAADTDTAAAVLGLPRPVRTPVAVVGSLDLDSATGAALNGAATIVDAGSATTAPPTAAGLRIGVLRGPCYLALATLLAGGGHLDGVVVVEEADRSLTARDVSDVLDVPVLATVRVSPAVARAIDAGMLVARTHRLPELADLRRLLRLTHTAPAPRDLDTDLHRRILRRRGTEVGCRDRPDQRHVVGACKDARSAEHRPAGRRGRRVLPRRGRDVERGVLHGLG